MPKQLIFDEEARSAMKRGIDTMADTVGVTLGPKGRNVVLDKKFGAPTITKDGSLPFYFKDLRDNTYVVLRGYLDGITENITPNWESQAYIGRSEPVYSYQNTERDINFNLKIIAQNIAELEMIYIKLNRLTSMCYPQYAVDKAAVLEQKDESEGAQEGSTKLAAQIRMKSPFTNSHFCQR